LRACNSTNCASVRTLAAAIDGELNVLSGLETHFVHFELNRNGIVPGKTACAVGIFRCSNCS